MKAIEINGEIKTFGSVPKKWSDENGLHLNIANGAAFGFKDVVRPDYDPRIQGLGDLVLDGDVYTYSVVDKEITESIEDLKSGKLSELKAIISSELDAIQWYWDRASRTNGSKPVPQDIIDTDAAIRAKNDRVEQEINNLTSKQEVLLYEFE